VLKSWLEVLAPGTAPARHPIAEDGAVRQGRSNDRQSTPDEGRSLLDPGQVWLCPAVDRFAPVNSNEPTLGGTPA
jgi:hypothetical protein